MRASALISVILAAVVAIAVAAWLATARQPVAPPAAPSAPPQRAAAAGTIRISGAWALYPMVIQWKEAFCKQNPSVRIDISAGGAGKGATDALAGLVDIGMVSREIHPDETNRGGWWVPVVKDAVFPVMNERNPVAHAILTRGLSQAAFQAIWIKQSAPTWGQVTGTNCPDPVHLFTRSDACGAAETWAKYLGGKQENLKGTGVFGDPGVAEAVRKDPLAVGYNNLNFAFDARTGQPLPGIRIIPINRKGNAKLEPGEDFYASKQSVLAAIQDGRYPSPPARDLNFLCRGKPTGVAAAFIRWCLTEGQQLAAPGGYIPLTKSKQEGALERLR